MKKEKNIYLFFFLKRKNDFLDEKKISKNQVQQKKHIFLLEKKTFFFQVEFFTAMFQKKQKDF
jgi:hypothetical protein